MALIWAVFMLLWCSSSSQWLAQPWLAAESGARSRSPVLRRVLRAHIVLLSAAIITILGAVAGAHGGRAG